jgi:DNA-binding XRE family transcriptional regulator
MPATKRIGNPRESLTEELRLEMNTRIGARLKSIRMEHNRQFPNDSVTQESLAHTIGVSVATMNKFERGLTGAQLPMLVLIAEFWGMSVQDMLGGIPSPTIEETFNAPRIKRILGAL